MNPDQAAPKGSSLIWVHCVCNVGFQSVYLFYYVSRIVSSLMVGKALTTFSRDLTIPHLDLSHFALCIMGN